MLFYMSFSTGKNTKAYGWLCQPVIYSPWGKIKIKPPKILTNIKKYVSLIMKSISFMMFHYLFSILV